MMTVAFFERLESLMGMRIEKPREIPSNLWGCFDKSAQRLFFDAVESTYDREANRQQQFLPAHVVLVVINNPKRYLEAYMELAQRRSGCVPEPAALRSIIVSFVGEGMAMTDHPLIPEETRRFLGLLADNHALLAMSDRHGSLSDRELLLTALESDCKSLKHAFDATRYYRSFRD
jgi:hypothetical protein